MKLAEALLERKRIKEEIAALRERAERDSRIQEGDRPAEDPEVLMGKILELVGRLQRLTVAINKTNMVVRLPDGRTLMEAIAERDMLKLLHEAAKEVADAAVGTREWRVTRSEIKFVPTVDVAVWRRRADEYAKKYRELDAAIQAANWASDLVEEV
ncbi:MAG: DIP1984 family protein [Moorellaceae bacterium]